jgi:toxin ParE1/3/4
MRSSRRLEFTPEADDDLRSLLADSFATWGETQQDAYAERLSTAMHELLVYPHLGRAPDDLRSGMRSLLVGHHVIYYLADDRTVAIIRLLHERMDPFRHLRPPQ